MSNWNEASAGNEVANLPAGRQRNRVSIAVCSSRFFSYPKHTDCSEDRSALFNGYRGLKQPGREAKVRKIACMYLKQCNMVTDSPDFNSKRNYNFLCAHVGKMPWRRAGSWRSSVMQMVMCCGTDFRCTVVAGCVAPELTWNRTVR